ncbi:MAG TPA: hypothetical protein VHX13_09375 [Acidobacteriaceae bacterium]|jgi:hypothetical protein|nr:hypothetical protein [Acidobacteriaceae bacterium]
MVLTPNTVGVVLLFLVTFLGCILWATHASPAEHGTERDKMDYHRGIQKPS